MKCRILLSKSKLWVIMCLLLRKVYNLLYISFSSIFSIFDNREIGWWLLQSNFEFFLKTGTTFAVLSTEGKTPVIKERLNKSANCFEISFLRRNNILKGILFGPKALLELTEDMMLVISSLSVGCRDIVLSLSFETVWKMFMCFFCSFSYRGKVTIKSVSNIVGIGYSITVITREYSWYTECYNFLRNEGFNSFQCLINIFPTFFQSICHNKPVYYSSYGWRVNFYTSCSSVTFLF